MTAADEVGIKLDELNAKVDEATSQLRDALQGAIDKIASEPLIPPPVKNYAIKEAESGWNQYIHIPPKKDPVVEALVRTISDYASLATAGPQYCEVDFAQAQAAIGPDALGPRDDDWTSSNTQLYRNAVYSLPTKLQGLQDAVRQFCQILRDLLADFNSFFIGVLVALIGAVVAVAGLIVAIVGLVLAIPSGGAGLVVAIVSLVIAIISAVVAIIAFITLPDLEASKQTAIDRLRQVAESVRNSPWPIGPTLAGEEW